MFTSWNIWMPRLKSKFARIMELIDEKGTKQIHFEED